MKNLEYLDELQLLKRGNVFKHGLLTLIGLLLFNIGLSVNGFDWAQGKWAELSIILFTVILCSIELIYYDIYPLTENRQKHLINFCGLFGLVSILACLSDFYFENVKIIANGKITDSALGIIYGFMFIAVFVSYKIKVRQNAKLEE